MEGIEKGVVRSARNTGDSDEIGKRGEECKAASSNRHAVR